MKYLACTSHVGLFEFLKAPFGLSTSPSVFQRFIYNVFRDHEGQHCRSLYG